MELFFVTVFLIGLLAFPSTLLVDNTKRVIPHINKYMIIDMTVMILSLYAMSLI